MVEGRKERVMLRASIAIGRCSLRDNVAGGERDAGKEGRKERKEERAAWKEGCEEEGRAGRTERRIGSF